MRSTAQGTFPEALGSCCLVFFIQVHSKEMLVRSLLSVDHGAAPFESAVCNLASLLVETTYLTKRGKIGNNK